MSRSYTFFPPCAPIGLLWDCSTFLFILLILLFGYFDFPQPRSLIPSNSIGIKVVMFEVFTVASMKVTAFRDIAPCSLVEVDRRFRAYTVFIFA
jgi:hypothetical protein